MQIDSTPAKQIKFFQINGLKRFEKLDAKKGKVPEDEKLKKACRDFESIFLYYVLKTMRKSIPKGGYLEGGVGQGIFQEMMDEKLAEKISRTGRMGIWEMLYRDLRDKAPHPVQRGNWEIGKLGNMENGK